MQQIPKKQNGGAGRGQGRKPVGAAGARVPIGVSRVAPDVAARIAAAPDRVAFIEQLVRAAPVS